jgi:tetratricopeptide (TPR) repeat protein
VAWIGYQLQSIISINQIGLAVWGWLLTGALIAYVNLDAQSSAQESVESSSKRKPNQQVSRGGSAFSTQLIAGVGAVLGLILSAPPISADMAWVKATQSRNAQEVEKALTPTYLHPSNSERYTQAIQLLENSGLFEQAHKYAQTAVAFNPDHFGSWFTLYSVSKSTKEEKALALKNLKRLDPYSKDVLAP